MASRLFASILRKQNPLLSRNWTPRLTHRQTQPLILQSTSASSVRYFSWPEISIQPVPATIVAELRKANVRCTKSGIKALDAAYANMPMGCVFRDKVNFWRDLNEAPVARPDYISNEDLNTRGVRQWRCWESYQACIDAKVYKLWEALYLHSEIFKELIDEEEEYLRGDLQLRSDLQSSELWWWMAEMVSDGYVERCDIDALPDFSLGDVVIHSERCRALVVRIVSEPSSGLISTPDLPGSATAKPAAGPETSSSRKVGTDA